MQKTRSAKLATPRVPTILHQLAKYDELIGLMENPVFHADMHEALDHHFEVLVMATMSAGKSTLLNAMLGMDLLPSKNEACTAIVYTIEDCDGMEGFECRAVKGEDITDWQPATPELLAQWNDSGLCTLVEIKGDLPFVKNRGAQLKLYDTPGPNNSVDERHAQVMRNIMQSQEYGLILFVLNATQLGTTDERILLDELQSMFKSKSKTKRKRVVFVMNKVDEIDDENDESLGTL